MSPRALPWLLLACLLAGAAEGRTPVPALAARTLDERPLRIPADLPGHPVLLVVGYTRASAAQASTWLRDAAQDQRLRHALDVYQVAVLERVPRPFRNGVVAGIRRGVPDARHGRFLVATTGEATWKRLTGYDDPDAAYVLLVDGGTIAWRGRGASSAAALAALRAVVAGTGGAPAVP